MKIVKKYTCFDNVSVFILDFAQNIDYIDYELIPKEQIQEINTYRLEKDRLKRLIARTFLFKHCKKHFHLEDFTFVFNEREKPQFKDNFPYFSISYSNDLIAIAISSTCKVGVDVEYLNRQMNICETSEIFMHKEEKDKFEKFTIFEEKSHFYYKVWTYKEAHLKAIGEGFFKDPRSISIYSKKDDFSYKMIEDISSYCLHVVAI